MLEPHSPQHLLTMAWGWHMFFPGQRWSSITLHLHWKHVVAKFCSSPRNWDKVWRSASNFFQASWRLNGNFRSSDNQCESVIHWFPLYWLIMTSFFLWVLKPHFLRLRCSASVFFVLFLTCLQFILYLALNAITSKSLLYFIEEVISCKDGSLLFIVNLLLPSRNLTRSGCKTLPSSRVPGFLWNTFISL